MITVDVCICTYNRASLIDTIESVALQQLPDDIHLRILVADNNVVPLLRRDARRVCDQAGLGLTYIHAPAKNIAVARNACLDHAYGEWLVFIDDDEVAQPRWFQELFSHAGQRDVIFGPVQAVYPEPRTPRWMWQGNFHSTAMMARDPPDKGFTGNVLIRRQIVETHSVRFSVGLGQLGGEDTLFFRQLAKLGARFAYVPCAAVLEEAAGSRVTLKWMFRRRYRMGQLHHMLLESPNGRRYARVSAAAKVAYSLGAAVLMAGKPAAAMAALLRASFHAGILAAGLGARQVREYGGPAG